MKSLIDCINESRKDSKYSKYVLTGLDKGDLRSGDILLSYDELNLYVSKEDLVDLKFFEGWVAYWNHAYNTKDPEYWQNWYLDKIRKSGEDGMTVLNQDDYDLTRVKMSDLDYNLKCNKLPERGGSEDQWDVKIVFRGIIDPGDLLKKHPRSARQNAKKILKKVWEDLKKSGFVYWGKRGDNRYPGWILAEE